MIGKLSERESAVLRIIETSTRPASNGGATGNTLAAGMRSLGFDTSEAGVHRTAASLVRKGLARRAGTSKLQWYRITQAGRDALAGDDAGTWAAR